MRFDPLFDELTYGLPSSPVEATIGGTRYTATGHHDVDTDEFDYRLTIAPPVGQPIEVSAIRLGLFGRRHGARITILGSTTTVPDTCEIVDVGVRDAVELALARAGAIGAGTYRIPAGLRRKGVGSRGRSRHPRIEVSARRALRAGPRAAAGRAAR